MELLHTNFRTVPMYGMKSISVIKMLSVKNLFSFLLSHKNFQDSYFDGYFSFSYLLRTLWYLCLHF